MIFRYIGLWSILSFKGVFCSFDLNEQQRHLLFEELIVQHEKIAAEDIIDDLAKYTDTFTHDEIIELFAKIIMMHKDALLERKKIGAAFKEAFYKKYSAKAQKTVPDSHMHCYLKGSLLGAFLTSAVAVSIYIYAIQPVIVSPIKPHNKGYRILQPLWYILGYK